MNKTSSMKKLTMLCMIAVLLTACKKKDEPTPDPEPEPVPTPSYVVSVKVDGVEKHCSSNCYSGLHSGGFRTTTLDLNASSEQIIIDWDNIPATGQHILTKYGEPSVTYQKSSSFYSARTGTMNITSLDTAANGAVTKLVATFSFRTDTVNGVSHQLTEGTINKQ